jgi:AraC-like DNA-binding protein
MIYETNARQVMIHSHDCLEINLIREGSGYYIIENETYPIRKDDIFIINNSEHHMAVHDGNLFMMVLVFSPELVWSSPRELGFLDPFFERGGFFSNIVEQKSPFHGEMRGYLETIADEFHRKAEGWELMVKANMLMFLGNLNRYYLGRNEIELQGGQGHGYSRIRGAVEYIHENFQREMTLTELAEQAAMGKSYFSFYFTNTMKMSVFDYIQQVRVNHAARLLKSTSESALEIAMQSGFHSSAYFNRVFKKIMKTTPLAYRKSKDSTKN